MYIFREERADEFGFLEVFLVKKYKIAIFYFNMTHGCHTSEGLSLIYLHMGLQDSFVERFSTNIYGLLWRYIFLLVSLLYILELLDLLLFYWERCICTRLEKLNCFFTLNNQPVMTNLSPSAWVGASLTGFF